LLLQSQSDDAVGTGGRQVGGAVSGSFDVALEGRLMVMATFQEFSYTSHIEHSQNQLIDDSKKPLLDSWFDETTAAYWLHARMYEAVDCVHLGNDEKWLTIGDGRFGLDALRIKKRGIKDILPTDISDALLHESLKRGIIEAYKTENAEHLSFPDNTFDFVFCKESLHHFPRPFLALYEMFRVCKKGIILIEPNDRHESLAFRFAFTLMNIFRKYVHPDQDRYEDSGNYCYSISRRAIEQFCLGLNIPHVSFKGISSYYIEGVEFVPASLFASKFLTVRFVILVNNLLTCFKLSDHDILMSCIFKDDLPLEVRHICL
jgi:ubiquinone/menaquinone biosynthesis C-methylase UbiE